MTGKQMEYRNLIKDPEYKPQRTLSKTNKLERLTQGVDKTKDGTPRVKGIYIYICVTSYLNTR